MKPPMIHIASTLLGDWRYINGTDGDVEVWDGSEWRHDATIVFNIEKEHLDSVTFRHTSGDVTHISFVPWSIIK